MRGTPDLQLAMLTSVSTEDLIPADRPIRRIRVVVDAVLAELDLILDEMYATSGRRSVPPVILLKATVLMAMYSIRSREGRSANDSTTTWCSSGSWTCGSISRPSTRPRSRRTVSACWTMMSQTSSSPPSSARPSCAATRRRITSPSTALSSTRGRRTSRSSPKTGRRRSRRLAANTQVQWHGEKRSNDTHASTTDPEARLYRKSNNTAATLCYAGHLLIEHRSALIVDAELATADGYAEQATALEMLDRLPKTKRRHTIAGDKNYDTKGFVADVRGLGFTPHVAQNVSGNRRSAIDGRTTRHTGHTVSQRIRKRVEEPFGWMKTIGGGHKLRHIGRQPNRAWFKMNAAVST